MVVFSDDLLFRLKFLNKMYLQPRYFFSFSERKDSRVSRAEFCSTKSQAVRFDNYYQTLAQRLLHIGSSDNKQRKFFELAARREHLDVGRIFEVR